MAAPALAILDAMQALLQDAFNAAPGRVGAPMTVLNRALSASKTTLFPVCRLFVVGETLEVLTQVSRSNDEGGSRLDLYGFRIEYRPVVASGIPIADTETQMYSDGWMIQNVLTAVGYRKLGGLVTDIVRVQVRYARGQYGSDTGNILLIAEGRIDARKKRYTGDAATNA